MSSKKDRRERPTILTERLLLRPFLLSDAPYVQRLAGDREIADTTLNVPHPYFDGMAEKWIGTHQELFEAGTLANFAIAHRSDGILVGAIGLVIAPSHNRGELGYWIGKEFWNRGYCTEAARAVIHYGFESHRLNRIYATYLTRNPASGRVMKKAGMAYEGRLRQHVKKWDQYEDLECYGILRPLE